MGSTNSRISAKRIQRETGVTYKTAWRALREIRRLLISEDPQPVPTATEMAEGEASGVAREEDQRALSQPERVRQAASVG